ncbi:hypothetical protein N7516_004853 [Penicillium verrucosum]|uniref:uncharacterized protein n=1 Tax=Penicillium verrucosum TaxID=60171 RepID=UPI002544EC77|nr:uncharacterized protein N7516_004853 [Penicillium verrucosum]KAJ5944685.1 hypothetical protein N7516_004853 [Penicillium verrucosum]
MSTSAPQEAKMACHPSDEAEFIEQQKVFRDRCSKALANHLKSNPDVVWTPKDGYGRNPTTKEEGAQLKLVLDVQFNEESGQWDFPPPNNRLSDELVYLATKFMNARHRARLYPYDFDPMGHINPQRVSSGPAPIIWAHGLPFFPVYKGYYILCGRDNANSIGWLLHEKTRDVMQSSPIWSIGAVIAPDSAVKAPHAITRQMTTHKPSGIESELQYRSKTWTRDFVAADHHLCAVLPNPEVDGIEICPLWKVWGYNVRCGPMRRGVKPTTMPRGFFTSHGIKDFDYDALSRPYSNQLMNEDGELDEQTDSDDDTEVEEPTGKSNGIACSGNQSMIAQSASQVDVDVDIVSPVEVPAHGPGQVTEKIPDDVKEEAKGEAKEEAPKDTETAPSEHEEKQPVLSDNTVDTELGLGMDIEHPMKESIQTPIPEQTSTTIIPLPETTIQTVETAEPSDVQPMTENHETEQAVTDASSANLHTTDPSKVEQLAPEQPGIEKLSHTTVCVRSEEAVLTEGGVDETEVHKSQAPAGAHVQEGGMHLETGSPKRNAK